MCLLRLRRLLDQRPSSTEAGCGPFAQRFRAPLLGRWSWLVSLREWTSRDPLALTSRVQHDVKLLLVSSTLNDVLELLTRVPSKSLLVSQKFRVVLKSWNPVL